MLLEICCEKARELLLTKTLEKMGYGISSLHLLTRIENGEEEKNLLKSLFHYHKKKVAEGTIFLEAWKIGKRNEKKEKILKEITQLRYRKDLKAKVYDEIAIVGKINERDIIFLGNLFFGENWGYSLPLSPFPKIEEQEKKGKTYEISFSSLLRAFWERGEKVDEKYVTFIEDGLKRKEVKERWAKWGKDRITEEEIWILSRKTETSNVFSSLGFQYVMQINPSTGGIKVDPSTTLGISVGEESLTHALTYGREIIYTNATQKFGNHILPFPSKIVIFLVGKEEKEEKRGRKIAFVGKNYEGEFVERMLYDYWKEAKLSSAIGKAVKGRSLLHSLFLIGRGGGIFILDEVIGKRKELFHPSSHLLVEVVEEEKAKRLAEKHGLEFKIIGKEKDSWMTLFYKGGCLVDLPTWMIGKRREWKPSEESRKKSYHPYSYSNYSSLLEDFLADPKRKLSCLWGESYQPSVRDILTPLHSDLGVVFRIKKSKERAAVLSYAYYPEEKEDSLKYAFDESVRKALSLGSYPMGIAVIGEIEKVQELARAYDIPIIASERGMGNWVFSLGILRKDIFAVSPGIKQENEQIYLVRRENLSAKEMKEIYKRLHRINKRQLATAMYPISTGGIATALAKMVIFGEYGVEVDVKRLGENNPPRKILFENQLGGMIFTADERDEGEIEDLLGGKNYKKIGKTIAEKRLIIRFGKHYLINESYEKLRRWYHENPNFERFWIGV